MTRHQALRWLLGSEAFVFVTAVVFGGVHVLQGDAWTGLWVLLGCFLVPQPLLLFPFRRLLFGRRRK
ncbi:MAG: hypothetical protein M3Q40_05585 [Pseudomonadota bacterium]|nr:hypothetical protein [Pseudomonadota bacterium]